MATLSPESLQNICLDYVAAEMCANANCSCGDSQQKSTTRSALYRSLHFTDNFYLHSNLADTLLSRIAEKNKLCCETLGAFTPRSTCLRRVKIKCRPSSVYHREMHILNQHQVIDFSYEEGSSKTTARAVVNKLIGCLSSWSRANLRSLNVAGCTFVGPHGAAVVVSLVSLRELRTLNVSRTDFNDNMLKIVVSELPKLENIDISSTLVTDILPLAKCSSRLRSLAMYNIRVCNDSTISILLGLSELRHLDISSDISSQQFITNKQDSFDVNQLLAADVGLKNLVLLDISGKQDVDISLLSEFLEKHENLRFLGLCTTGISDSGQLADLISKHQKNIKFSGISTVELLVESFSRYVDRQFYMRTCLYELFSHSEVLSEPCVDLIKLILPVLRHHMQDVSVQMAGTACLYNLCRGEVAKSIHTCLLSNIVDHVLDVMTNSLNRQQLMKNCLLVLCHDRILQDVAFDRYRCATLVFDCLLKHEDATMCRLAVAICGILGSKIPTSQSALLGGCREYMRKLLSIIKSKIETQTIDVTLKFTLSTLWNLSDEAPATCESFVAESGMQVYVNLLETFKSEPEATLASIEVKMLGFLNNMAEVEHLKHNLMEEKVLAMVRELLLSKHQDVSYFSGGIYAHLLSSNEPERSRLCEYTRHEMLQELEAAVTGWKQPEQEMVAYRSFIPFFKLLDVSNEAPIQMWALWAWRHVCSRNGSRYCSMLVREGGFDVLEMLLAIPNLSSERPLVAQLAAEVMHIVLLATGNGGDVQSCQ